MVNRVKANYEVKNDEIHLSNLTTRDENNSQYNLGIGQMTYLNNDSAVYIWRGMDFWKIARLGCLDAGSFGQLEYDKENVPKEQILVQANEEGFGEALMVYQNSNQELELLIPKYEGVFEEFNEINEDIVEKEYDKLRSKDLIPEVSKRRSVKVEEFGHPNMYKLFVDGEKLADNVLFTSEASNKTLELMFPVKIIGSRRTPLVPGKSLFFYDGEGYNRAFVVQDLKNNSFDVFNKKYELSENKFVEVDVPGQKVFENLSEIELKSLISQSKQYFIESNNKKDWISKVDGIDMVSTEKFQERTSFDFKYRGFPNLGMFK